jgi:hypothetical protein
VANTPPTFVGEFETAWNSGTQPKAVSTTVDTNDRIVIGAIAETQLTWTAPSGGGFTYTAGPTLNPANYCSAAAWTMLATSGQTYSLTMGNNSGTSWWGWNGLRFSGSDGIGQTASTNTTGAPSLSITTLHDNSAIAVFVGDWNATDGTSRTWRTVNGTAPTAGNGFERTYFRDASHYTTYAAYYPDAGTAGAKTVGLSAPSGQQYTILAVEVRGSAAGAGATAPPILQRIRRHLPLLVR